MRNYSSFRSLEKIPNDRFACSQRCLFFAAVSVDELKDNLSLYKACLDSTAVPTVNHDVVISAFAVPDSYPCFL